jgi:hypothetical protein
MRMVILVLFSLASTQSLAAKINKPAYVTADFGYMVMPIVGTGFSLGAAVDQKNGFEFSYARGERDVEYAVMTAEIYKLQYKRFWTTSLYTNTGVSFKNVSDQTTDKVSPMFTAERRANSYGLDFSIGQKWDFDGIQVGVDYVGFFQPIEVQEKRSFLMKIARGRPALAEGRNSKQVARPTHGGHGGSANARRGGMDYDRHENDWNRLANYATLQVLKAYIGWSF